jgi:hypothetical protein
MIDFWKLIIMTDYIEIDEIKEGSTNEISSRLEDLFSGISIITGFVF